MNYSQFSFETHKSIISGQYIQPQKIEAVVVLVHGFGEHSGRYHEQVVPALLETGCAVVLYDNIGHGKSGGKRGHCPSYSALLDILAVVISKAISFFPDLPLFLYGHSMGGNLVLNFGMRRENNIKAIVATSPYLRLAFEPPGWKMLLGKLMLKIMPSITLPSGLDPKGISRRPEEVEKYIADPLVHDRVSPMFSFPVMDAGNWAVANAAKLSIPTLLVHGTADPIIDHNGTREFHKNSNSTVLELFPDAYHELHYDLCRAQLLEMIRNLVTAATLSIFGRC